MPVPKANIPEYKKTERSKMTDIVTYLYKIGYNVDDARTAIKIIEDDNLDKSQFDFPYGSFEETKSHAFAGEFDFDESVMMTDAEREQFEKDIKEGKLWITY